MANSENSPLSSASSSLSSLQTDDGDSGNASPNDSDIFDFDAINTDDLLQVEENSFSINSPGCLFENDPCLAYSPFVINTPGLNEHYSSPDDGYHSFSSSTECNTSPVSVESFGSSCPLLSQQSDNSDTSVRNVSLVVTGSLLTAVPVTAFTSTFRKPTIAPSNQGSEKTTRCQSNEKIYTAQEIKKMRNRESARASKEKQKSFIAELQKLINVKDSEVKSLLKQCQEKDSLIEILQEQNRNLMVSLAQHQVKLKELEARVSISNSLAETPKQPYLIKRDISVCPNTVVPISKSKLPMFIASPNKRACLAVLFCFFIFNFGINIHQEPSSIPGKSVINRRLLQVNDMSQDTRFEQDRSIYGEWDPLGFLKANKRRARNLNDQESVGYDQLTIPVAGDNSTLPSEECRNHYTNVSNSNRIVKELTQVIEHHQKLTTKSKAKSTRYSHKNPSLELQELFKKTSNPVLMKAMYDMLNSWERKDDTVYMFAFGSNEWFLPKSKQASNSSHDTKLLRPKMSLVMPALNNSELNLDTSDINEAFKNGNELSSLLGLYLMQIDCLVVDTHLLTYNTSSPDHKVDQNKGVNSLNNGFIPTGHQTFGPRRKQKT